jgi:hypothetical protein
MSHVCRATSRSMPFLVFPAMTFICHHIDVSVVVYCGGVKASERAR